MLRIVRAQDHNINDSTRYVLLVVHDHIDGIANCKWHHTCYHQLIHQYIRVLLCMRLPVPLVL
jgi:hypothetical protein